MLRLRFWLAAASFAGLASSTIATTPVFAGDGTAVVDCSQSSSSHPMPGCDATISTGAGGGSAGGGGRSGSGGDGVCRKPSGEQIPCSRDGAWANSSDGCYYAPADLSADTIAGLGGQPAGEGGWYVRTCYGTVPGGESALSVPVWVAGAPPVVSPAVLARQARARLELPGVVIGLNPPGDQLVNLPLWLALDAASWRAQSATASVPGVSVTVTARPVTATWSMGDGATVTCDGPGTSWRVGTDPVAASPDCGHTYRRSSAGSAGGAFAASVVVAWEVTWAGAGQSGTVPGLITTGGVQVRVQESQALIRS